MRSILYMVGAMLLVALVFLGSLPAWLMAGFMLALAAVLALDYYKTGGLVLFLVTDIKDGEDAEYWQWVTYGLVLVLTLFCVGAALAAH